MVNFISIAIILLYTFICMHPGLDNVTFTPREAVLGSSTQITFTASGWQPETQPQDIICSFGGRAVDSFLPTPATQVQACEVAEH